MITELFLKLVLLGKMENNFPWNKTESYCAKNLRSTVRENVYPQEYFILYWEVLVVDKHDATIDSQLERLA